MAVILHGPNSPSTASSINFGSGGAWTNPNNIVVLDATYATSLSQTEGTDYLYASNFGFTVPTTVTIVGVLVEIAAAETGNVPAYYAAVYLTNESGASVGTPKTTASNSGIPGASISYAAFGDETDMWGLNTSTLTPAIVNDPQFGVMFRFADNQASTFLLGHYYVDHVRITVYADYPEIDQTGADTDAVGVTEAITSIRLTGASAETDAVSVTEAASVVTRIAQSEPVILNISDGAVIVDPNLVVVDIASGQQVYYVGADVRCQAYFYKSGTAYDPSIITFYIRHESESEATLPEVKRATPGVYYTTIALDQPGVWYVRVSARGDVIAAAETKFYVAQTAF